MYAHRYADVIDAVSSDDDANVARFEPHSMRSCHKWTTWTTGRVQTFSCDVSHYVATPLQCRCCRSIFAFVIPSTKPTNVHLFTSAAAFIAIVITSYLPSAMARMGIVKFCVLGVVVYSVFKLSRLVNWVITSIAFWWLSALYCCKFVVTIYARSLCIYENKLYTDQFKQWRLFGWIFVFYL